MAEFDEEDEVVRYKAKSVLQSSTLYVNAAILIFTKFFPQVTEKLGVDGMVALTVIANGILRFITTRPIALVGWGNTKTVEVKKI